MNDRVAVIFICRKPSAYIRELAGAIARARAGLDVMIVSDRDRVVTTNQVPEIFIADRVCLDAGFQWSNFIGRKAVSGWDRALYQAATLEHRHCWFVEDDVLFADPQALLRLIDRHAGSSADAICAEIFDKPGNPDWHHWHTAEGFFPEPVAAHAFVPLCRLSRPVLAGIAEIAHAHGKLTFVETMVGSIVKALHLRAAIFDPSLAVIRYRPVFERAEAQAHFARGVLAVHPCKEIVDG